jgi:DNA-binding MarR family transcriptional regulator
MLEIRCSLTTAMLSYTAHDMSIGRDVRIVAAGLSRLLTGRATIDGLKPTETAVLFALSQSSPQTNAQLTISIGSEKAHVSRAVSALLNKGFVKFEVSVRHKSQRLLYLSKTGSQVVEDISEAGVPSMMARLGSLEPVVRSALSTLARYFERSAPERPNDDSHYSLTACDIRDLAWLASPRGWLPGIRRVGSFVIGVTVSVDAFLPPILKILKTLGSNCYTCRLGRKQGGYCSGR